MALSNIFNEPRREIIETVVGVALPAAILIGLYLWGANNYDNGERVCDNCGRAANIAVFMIFTSFFAVCAGAVLAMAAVAIHELGEVICNFLDGLGIRLRPRR